MKKRNSRKKSAISASSMPEFSMVPSVFFFSNQKEKDYLVDASF